jgi:hypothetical protein
MARNEHLCTALAGCDVPPDDCLAVATAVVAARFEIKARLLSRFETPVAAVELADCPRDSEQFSIKATGNTMSRVERSIRHQNSRILSCFEDAENGKQGSQRF